jgi:hypothetical protein
LLVLIEKNSWWYADLFLLIWWYAVEKRLGTPVLEQLKKVCNAYCNVKYEKAPNQQKDKIFISLKESV